MGQTWHDDEPGWTPEPLAVRTVAILSFLVGFALCYLIFVP